MLLKLVCFIEILIEFTIQTVCTRPTRATPGAGTEKQIEKHLNESLSKAGRWSVELLPLRLVY